MTTDPHPTDPAPHTDPMSDVVPMGASDRVEALPAAPTPGQIVVSGDPAGGRPLAFRVDDAGGLQHLGEILDDGIERRPSVEPLPQRVPPAPVGGTPPPYGHDAHPFATFDPSAAPGSWAGVDVYPVEQATAEPYARGGLIGNPGPWAEPSVGCEYIVPRTAPAGVLNGHPLRMDAVARRAVLERLGVEPWRIPAWGLLEYDEIHDEWRVELLAQGDAWCAGPPRTVIVRRYAGRRVHAVFGRRPAGFISLNRYLADGGDPGPDFYFGPPSLEPEPAWSPRTHARYVARWRRVAQAFRRHHRGGFGKVPAGRPLRARDMWRDGSDQVDAVRYAINTLSSAVSPAVDALRHQLEAGRRGRA